MAQRNQKQNHTPLTTTATTSSTSSTPQKQKTPQTRQQQQKLPGQSPGQAQAQSQGQRSTGQSVGAGANTVGGAGVGQTTSAKIIVHHFSDHDIHEFREAFNLLDGGKGWIPTKQIGVVMRKLGQNPTEDALANIQNEVDPDGEGMIDFDRFLKCMAISTKADSMQELEDIKSAFRCFDKTKDGAISAEEFRYVMARLGEKVTNKEINEMLAAIDLDGDGQITLDEFQSKMMGYKRPL